MITKARLYSSALRAVGLEEVVYLLVVAVILDTRCGRRVPCHGLQAEKPPHWSESSLRQCPSGAGAP